MNFERVCNLLGENRVTGMVTVARSVAASPDEYLRQVEGLRSQHDRTAVGIAVQNLSDAMEWGDDAPFDFVKLARGATILRHPPEMLDHLAQLAARNIPALCGGVFQGGFLVGGSKFDKRVIDPNNPADQALITWRKAFTALCHGHGVRPAHACIQFALSIPGVTTLSITTAHADRIAENCDAAMNPVPSALWDSMREEGLFVDAS
jgi:D-threo-aldose 1-dehydrogenase